MAYGEVRFIDDAEIRGGPAEVDEKRVSSQLRRRRPDRPTRCEKMGGHDRASVGQTYCNPGDSVPLSASSVDPRSCIR